MGKAVTRTRRLFCFGLGFSAAVLAGRLAAAGWEVAGTVRTKDRAAELRARGFDVHLFDGAGPTVPRRALMDASHILASVPPGQGGDPVLAHYSDTIAEIGSLVWLGYFSTTGVYGTRDGGWVNEASPLRPTGPRGRRRVEAERRWVDLWRGRGVAVHVFRLAGIYGPGRNAFLDLRRATAKRIDKPGQVFSRIHVDDVAVAVEASMANPRPGAVYNLCDDAPAPPADVVAYAARLMGVEPPPLVPFEQAELSPMARSFYADNKRVRNDLIKRELGVELSYPDYKAGLDALFRAKE